jgi:hypothetical protein
VPTPLASADLGPLTLLAPEDPPRHVKAAHGHLWQWVGDGADLFTLAVAVRPTLLATPTGTRDHLRWELDQLRPGPAPTADAPVETDVMVHVDGATGAAAADLVGEVRGNAVRQRVVVSTDGVNMHVVRVIVPDTEDGAVLLERLTSSLHVQPWSMMSA